MTDISNGRCWIIAGALFCGLSVALGAFAAHGLDKVFIAKYQGQTREVGGQTLPLASKFLNDFKTAAEYQMYHGLALIALGLIGQSFRTRWINLAGWSFSVGIILFSGSLYLLTSTGVTKWGAVTPIGGVAFLFGWSILCLSLMKQPASK